MERLATGLVPRPRSGSFPSRLDKAAPSLIWLAGTPPPRPSNEKWCGDLTAVATGGGQLYLAAAEDVAVRQLPAFATGEHHDRRACGAALKEAAAVPPHAMLVTVPG